MLNKPNVAVLLAAYNGMQWIEEQVESIFLQSSVNITLFISVDLSTDGTHAWAQELADKDARVHVLSYGERFGGAGPNFFRLIREVDFAGFDAVALADQDDIWLPEKLKRACEKILSKQCDAYSSNVIAFWQDGREFLIDKAQPQRKLDYFFEAAGPGCTYVFSHKIILELQDFLNKMEPAQNKISLHDWFAYAFVRSRGYTWYIDPVPSMRYRQHENNQLGTNTGLDAYMQRFKLIQNSWFKQQIHEIAKQVDPENHEEIKRKLYLIRNFRQLRRRTRDSVFLLIALLTGIQ